MSVTGYQVFFYHSINTGLNSEFETKVHITIFRFEYTFQSHDIIKIKERTSGDCVKKVKVDEIFRIIINVRMSLITLHLSQSLPFCLALSFA